VTLVQLGDTLLREVWQMPESKTLSVYRSLKDDIISLKYDSDELIQEKTVAEQYGVSKTPAREALNMLVQEGYLRKYPRWGYSINEVSETRYYKLLFLRYTLEKGVLASIIANCSDEEINGLYQYCRDTEVSYKDYAAINLRFHFAMADIAGNEDLAEAVRGTFAKLIRPPSKTLYKSFSAEPHKQHKELIAALLRRDIDGAMAILRVEVSRDDDPQLWF